MDTTTLYSRNDEEFRATDPAEVLDELWNDGELAVGAKYYECDFKPLTMLACMDANHLLDNAGDSAYDLVGEAMDCDNPFDDATEEAKKELNDFLEAWAAKHLRLGRFCTAAGKSKELSITEDDVVRYTSERR